MDELEGETVVSSLKGTLKRLGTDYVDLLLLHVREECCDLKAAWMGMIKAKRAGLVKSVGVANFNVQQLKEVLNLNSEKPVVNKARISWFTSRLFKNRVFFFIL